MWRALSARTHADCHRNCQAGGETRLLNLSLSLNANDVHLWKLSSRPSPLPDSLWPSVQCVRPIKISPKSIGGYRAQSDGRSSDRSHLYGGRL
jgi:hypothetical protein